MKNFILTIIGVATLLIALTLNFRHALDDYGVTKNKLHMEVLAQTNDTGGGGTSGGDSSGGDSSGGGSNEIKIGPYLSTGSCTNQTSVSISFSESEVSQAKKILGLEATTTQIAKWLLNINGSANYEGSEQLTSNGGLVVSFTTGSVINYGWIQCLGQSSNSCIAVPPYNCN
jgi:hypothetical protein